MKKFFSLLIVFAALLLPAANLIVDPGTGKLRGGKAPAGITAELRDGRGFITIEGENRQLNMVLPLKAGERFVRVRMRMRVTGVVPAAESWQDARLAMRFYDRNGKGVGEWPQVFSARGTGDWIDCDRLYPVPEGAVSLTLGPANFGTAGKVEFADLLVEAVNERPSPVANLIIDPGTGKLRGGKAPAGITAELRDGRGFITIEGENRQLNMVLPLKAGERFVRVRMRMRVTGVVPAAESWQDARLAMRFYDRNGKGVGEWPQVFSARGTGDWIDCDRLYPVPEGAVSLTLGPANFGTAGKVEFADLLVEAVNDPAAMNRDVPPPGGLTVEELFSLADAEHVTTPSRERICLNGLWQFRPVLQKEEIAALPPEGSGWGYFKIPGAWPVAANGMSFYLSPLLMAEIDPWKLNSAWYRREIEVPAEWSGREIILSADLIQSCAKIFVDGIEAGEFYYPGGEADLTGKLIPGKKQTLALLVSANPEESATFMAADRLIKNQSALQNRGITGNLFLESRPIGAAVSDVHVITSVQNAAITFDTGFVALPAGRYRLEAELFDADGRAVKRFLSTPFRSTGKPGFRHSFGGAWQNPKLWDIDTPGNLYTAKVRLLDDKGGLLDEFLPQEFGFREFCIDGRDFYLNGRKIHLRALVTKTPQEADFGSELWIEHLVRAARGFGANFLIGWNYSFSPGVFCYLDGFHRGTSRRGMLTSLTLPHFKDFNSNLKDPEQAAAYRRQAEHLIRRFQNVPGVVMLVMNHNATGYSGDQNPMRIGTAYKPEEALPDGALANRAQAVLAENIARKLDPSRPIYHHEGGNIGDVYTLNCYLNWAPRQERADWLENWEKNGTMPLVFVEWGLPHVASWSSYRGPSFIWSTKGLQCLWTNEFNAAILGEKAYRDEPAKQKLYDHQEKMIKGNELTFFSALGGNSIMNRVEDVNRVRAYYAQRVFRSLRARGISGILPWDQFLCWKWVADGPGVRQNPDRFRNLKQPGLVPDLLIPRGEYINNPFARYELNTTGEAVHAGFTEFLGWIGGKAGDITEEGHNFRPGETVRKTLVVLNDSRREAKVEWRWRVPALGIEKSGSTVVAPAGRCDLPVEFTIPTAGAPEKFALEAEFDFPGQGRSCDRFMVDLVAQAAVKLASRVGLYDPEGKASLLLNRLGIPFRTVHSDRDLNGIEILILGRNALHGFPLHLSQRLENGLKLLVLEQPAQELNRLGLRTTEQGFREVFSVSDFSGDLRDWRGSATQLPGTFPLVPYEATSPQWDWNGFSNTRVWRAGNRGSLTEVLFEKPQVGNWNPLLQCGFDLQYVPLVEFVEGKGRIMFCQLAVTGRTEIEPQADDLLGRALERLDSARGPAPRNVRYLGGSEGAALLDALRIPRSADSGSTPAETLLVLGPGAEPGDLTDAVAAGLNVLALGFGQAELESMLPGKFHLQSGGYYSDQVENLRATPEFTGIGNAELHWRGKMQFDAFAPDSAGGRSLGIVRHGKGVFVSCQLPPWKFDEEEFYYRTTRRRSTFLVSRLAANLGARFESGLFALFDGVKGNLKFELPNDRWIGIADPEGEGRDRGWMNPDFRPNSRWRPVRVPGNFDVQFKELAKYDGLFWYRLEFELPGEFASSGDVELFLGAIDDESWTWLNGHFLGEVTKQTHPDNYWEAARIHHVDSDWLRPGKNVLVVLCNDTYRYGGILGIPKFKIPRRFDFYTDRPIASDDPYRYYRW